MTGASATLRASLTGECPALRIHDSKDGRVTDIVHRSLLTENGRAECHRCGRVVGVTRRWDNGRWGWSPWRYDTHKPADPVQGDAKLRENSGVAAATENHADGSGNA